MKLSQNEIIAGVIIIILIAGLGSLYYVANRPYCGDGICQNNEQKICFADCSWCGDGVCQESEQGSCSSDCDWCGDNFCQTDESCSSCAQDCGDCEADAYCGNGICNRGECEIGCAKDCSFLDCENGICEPEGGENCVTSPNDCRCKSDEVCNLESKQCAKVTCGNGVCDSGETHLSCPNDCKKGYKVEEPSPDEDYPLIFIHGHSVSEGYSQYSLHAFSEFQDKLAQDGYYEDRGIILASDEKVNFEEGQWKKTSRPISLRATYYKGEYSSASDLVLRDDNYHIQKYSERLSKIIDIVLYATKKNKVDIVAHSMGGLVTRRYLKEYGTSRVNKVVTIGTPNHGIYGWVVSGLCENYIPFVPGRKASSPECDDMQHDGEFIRNLNEGDETPGNVKYLTIAGNCGHNGEDYHDEVIRLGSVKLEGARNEVVMRGECVPTLKETLHGHLIKPSKIQEVYNYVIAFLRG